MEKIVIGSRKSDLARLQAYSVAQALRNIHPSVFLEFSFKESLGDKNLTDPLWKMPEKGVFTQDFVMDLVNQKVDLVVHSWKDLPTDPRPGLKIVATLPREDLRDVLLVKRDFDPANKIVFSSSPRREKNISEYLKHIGMNSAFEFRAVRGNIATRIKKFAEDSSAWGLVVAQAALSRLCSPFVWEDSLSNVPLDDFRQKAAELKQTLASFQWIVCPLTHNPTAAAQGAIAIEIRENDSALENLLCKLNHKDTFDYVEQERREFKSYGGGCHQKIGISKFSIADKQSVTVVRGETVQGEELQSVQLVGAAKNSVQPTRDTNSLWNSQKELKQFAVRKYEPLKEILDQISTLQVQHKEGLVIWVSRSFALPQEVKNILRPQDRIWASGIQTQRDLIKKGFWVNGSSESLGLNSLQTNFPFRWDTKEIHHIVYLTHLNAPDVIFNNKPIQTLRCYQVSYPEIRTLNIEKALACSQYFWGSSSHFQLMLKNFPELFKDQSKVHFCGTGRSYDEIQSLSKDLPVWIRPTLMSDIV